MCVIGLLFTVGMLTLVGVKIYMENKLSYFTFHWPILSTVGVMFSLVLINVMVTHFIQDHGDYLGSMTSFEMKFL